MNFQYLAASLALACGLAAGDALAQTVYKLIDKNGKVTYVEKVPEKFDGKVIRMDIDPNANTATLPKPPPPKGEGQSRSNEDYLRDGNEKREADRDRLELAREKLQEALRALGEAQQNPEEGDIQWIGNVGGGARPVHTDQYRAKLERLDKAVQSAQAELRRAERGER